MIKLKQLINQTINSGVDIDKYLIYFEELKKQYQQLKDIYVLYGGKL